MNEGNDMHDFIINSYHINFKNRTIEICAQDRKGEKTSRFLAKNVLTHSFQSILEYNIILDFEECDINNFIKDNLTALEKKKQECWPVDYENIQELKNFLISKRYKYIKVRCSYGLQGWILAKEFQVI